MIPAYDPDGEPLSTEEWAELLGQRGVDDPAVYWWRAGRDEVGPYRVSTVWLGADHNWSGRGEPLTWETMVFCDDENDRWAGFQVRYPDRASATAGHESTVAALRRELESRVADRGNGA